jgi:hypothetical protein
MSTEDPESEPPLLQMATTTAAATVTAAWTTTTGGAVAVVATCAAEAVVMALQKTGRPGGRWRARIAGPAPPLKDDFIYDD